MTKIALILVAAGKSARFGGKVPKQYEWLSGKPLMLHTLNAFKVAGVEFSQTIIVVSQDDAYIDDVLAKLPQPHPKLVTGGATRTESVAAGLSALRQVPPDYVLIHDAARPLVSQDTIHAVIAALNEVDAAVPVLPIVDALKIYDGTQIGRDYDRNALRRVQTPQGFHYKKILAAFDALTPQASYPDDIAVAISAGMSVKSVDGSEQNFKVTYPEDLKRAEFTMSMNHADFYTAVGQGFDVHRFEPGDTLWLCGVELQAGMSLKGHSDADVGLHALTDAILGALCEGDIGDHFPPSDPQWKGASSDKFIQFAKDRVSARGGQIEHVDVTLICEKPKINPHRDDMRARIGTLLGLPIERVSVKATTTEKLGFTGRGEGLAAQASASLRLPSSTRSIL